MSVENDWVDMTLGPMAVEWSNGAIPNVESVPYDCVIILWSRVYIGFVIPHGDALNPLRWVNSTYFPAWGVTPPTGWWAWLKKGSHPRPSNVRLYGEPYSSQDNAPLKGDVS